MNDKMTAYYYGMYLAMEGRFDEYSFAKKGEGYIIEKNNEDASQRLAFGLCKKYGIELPKGATPGDAWQALREKTGKSAQDIYQKSGQTGHDKVKFNTSNPKTFVKKLQAAKATQNPRDAWRVTGMSKDELTDWHPGAKLHVTDGGSTIAIDKGDIIGVCVGSGDGKGGLISGSTLLEYAVKNGGNKLDSYDGNHRFYTKNGFEPISWCKWDPNYEQGARDQGWNPDKGDAKEDIVFYKYVGKGKVKNVDLNKFKHSVAASEGYGEAQEKRDAAL